MALKLGNKQIILLLSILIAVFFYSLFGITGLRTIAGIFLLFFIPFYLIMDYFNLGVDEKLIFSFFLGIGFYSSLAYYLGLISKSLRIGMLVNFVILVAIGLFFQYKKRYKRKTQQG